MTSCMISVTAKTPNIRYIFLTDPFSYPDIIKSANNIYCKVEKLFIETF